MWCSNEDCFPYKEQYKALVPRYDTTLLKAWQSAKSPTEQVSAVPTSAGLQLLPSPLLDHVAVQPAPGEQP